MLIAMSAIDLAFNSKNELPFVLLLEDKQTLAPNQIEGLNDQFKEYFESICDLKQCICSLKNYKDLNWEQLMDYLDNPSKASINNWEDAPQKIQEQDRKSMELAEKVFLDEAFHTCWKNQNFVN